MKAGNITSGVRDHRADFPDPAALGQSPHESHTGRASSVDAHGVIRSLRCVPRVPCKLHLRLAAAPAWLDGSGSTDQARRIKLNGGTPARPGRRLRAPDSAQRRAPRKSRIAPPECPPLFGARRLARRAPPPRQASLRRPVRAAPSTLMRFRADASLLPPRRLLGSVSAPAYFRLGARFVSAFAWFRGLLDSAPTPTLFR